jgi:hypothetical protein
MPLTSSYNVRAANNQQPEYQMLWEPIAFNPASVATLTQPTAVSTTIGYAVPGCALMYGLMGTQAGVGSYPPQGPIGGNTGSWYPGGDSGVGSTGNTTFPYNWTVQYVDVASTSATAATGLAGVCLGTGGTLGAYPQPQALTTPSNAALGSTQPFQDVMVGKRGICQLLFDGAVSPTVVGHTVKVSTTHPGCFSDNGNTTVTFGTTVGIVLQAVTLTVPTLVWCAVNFPV